MTDPDVEFEKEVSVSGLRRSIRNQEPVVKMENLVDGTFSCPSCDGSVLASSRGCNVLTCRNHSPEFFFFCCFCKAECPGGVSACSCARRNDARTRHQVLIERNEASRLNPVDLTGELQQISA